uniref:Uncharacterized protein n=1 Tax=Prolemur simus TaxID=1328070 RepID=A0A8C9AK39_PROSS
MCVFGGWGWVLAGVGLAGVWEGLGERWRVKSPKPFPNSKPQKPGRESAYSCCRVSCRCAKIGVGGGEGAWQSSPQGGSLKAIQFPCLGDSKTGERVGVGTWGFPMYSCVYSGVFSVWYPLWASMCV